jgi:hypothetical protein
MSIEQAIEIVSQFILDNDDRPRLSGIILTAGNGPNFTAFHGSTKTDIASIKAWSSKACSLLATTAD